MQTSPPFLAEYCKYEHFPSMARERPEGVFVVGSAVCPCTVSLLPSQGTSFKFADLAPHLAKILFHCRSILSGLQTLELVPPDKT